MLPGLHSWEENITIYVKVVLCNSRVLGCRLDSSGSEYFFVAAVMNRCAGLPSSIKVRAFLIGWTTVSCRRTFIHRRRHLLLNFEPLTCWRILLLEDIVLGGSWRMAGVTVSFARSRKRVFHSFLWILLVQVLILRFTSSRIHSSYLYVWHWLSTYLCKPSIKVVLWYSQAETKTRPVFTENIHESQVNRN
jgi:hypothetical protein